MIKKSSILAILLVFSCSLFINSVAEARGNTSVSSATEMPATQQLSLKLAGTGHMHKMHVPGIEEAAMCFDIDLIDMRTDLMIGTATDCLSNITEAGNGVHLIGTTFFNLPNGTLVSRGKVSIQPVLVENVTIKPGQPITHITGAATTENTIIGGTGIFQDSTGNTRLSGMVNMSGFQFNEGDPLVFNCLFEILLNLP